MLRSPSHLPLAGETTTFVGHAFGVDVHADFAVNWLSQVRRDAVGFRCDLAKAAPGEIDRVWPAADAQRVLERHYPDGRLGMSVDGAAGAGYLVTAPGHGRHLIAADGTSVLCEIPDGVGEWRWHRLLFAQVLPTVATLLGLEPIHASAVTIDDRVVAFVGPPGAGKSSISGHLAAGGAQRLTDDVLAVEAVDGDVLAHPGIGIANMFEADLESVLSRGADLDAPIAVDDKALVPVRLDGRALPLERIYFVKRGVDDAEIGIEPIPEPDPVLLMGSTFIEHVNTPARLFNQLSTWGAVGDKVKCFWLRIPGGVPADVTVAALRAHLEEGS